MKMRIMDDIFVLKKDIGNLKKGKKFSAYGGLVSGIIIDKQKLNFCDIEYFKLKKIYNKIKNK